ncbi:MAG: tetratricopeptide repeat protein [Verrucomicrobiota bacterium]|nr:tetratricopeptide repeat protein [Verrucomicrobiota bacterium]
MQIKKGLLIGLPAGRWVVFSELLMTDERKIQPESAMVQDEKPIELTLEEQLQVWWQDFKLPIIFGSIFVVLVAIGYPIYTNYRESQERAAGVMLAQIAPSEGEIKYAELTRIGEQYPDTQSAGRAWLILAAHQFNTGKNDEAIVTYKKFLAEYSDHELAGSAALGIGSAHEAAGRIPDAISQYGQVRSKFPNSFWVGEALLSLGRCYQINKDYVRARQIYDEINSNQNLPGSIKSRAEVQKVRLNYFQPAQTQALPVVAPSPTSSAPMPSASSPASR